MTKLKVKIEMPPTSDIEEYVNDILEGFVEDDGVLTAEGLKELKEIAFEIMTDNMEIEITQEVS